MAEYLELVEGSFNESHFNKQQNQNPYVAYSIRDNKVIYTIIPKEEGTMYTIYRVVSKDTSNCTYNMVDLGLSVKWADRNVGATSPEHYGSYFQWGDTNAYTFDGAGEITAAELAEILNPILSPQLGEEITADNIGAILEQMGMTSTDLTPMGIGRVLGKFFNWDSYNNEVDVITGWEEDEDGNRYPTGFKKYNSGENGLTVLESGDDAATVYMGSSYRMPTIDEIRELTNNTTQTFIDIDGNEYSKEQAQNGAIEQGNLKGVKFTSKTVKDDNNEFTSIFIPAAGYCGESLLNGIGADGELWSSSLDSAIDSNEANYLEFDNAGEVYHHHARVRNRGGSVRGVQA